MFSFLIKCKNSLDCHFDINQVIINLLFKKLHKVLLKCFHKDIPVTTKKLPLKVKLNCKKHKIDRSFKALQSFYFLETENVYYAYIILFTYSLCF